MHSYIVVALLAVAFGIGGITGTIWTASTQHEVIQKCEDSFGDRLPRLKERVSVLEKRADTLMKECGLTL